MRKDPKRKIVLDGDAFQDYYTHLNRVHPAHDDDYVIDDVFYDATNRKTHVTLRLKNGGK